MRILTLTTLYPNAEQPSHGVFVENRLGAFAERSGAEIKVVAPVPWFPLDAGWAGKYAAYARAPKEETRRGFDVRHPRYFIPPRIGMTYAARSLERCFLRAARAFLAEGWDFDLIDAHYLYPDGVAAARVAKKLGKPVVLTARGTDVTLIPSFARQRAMIMNGLRDADAVVTVASSLKDELIRLGAPAEKINVLRNGVDLQLFRPLYQPALRTAMQLGGGKVVASVGHLIERKGHHLAIEAIASLPEVMLIIAGAGEERGALERLAASHGVADRVRFLGAVPHERLPEIYAAADALVLASSREGWPNVLLEAMACGTPAVATPIWGSVEVVAAPAAGILAANRSVPAITEALRKILDNPPDREATRRYAEGFSWDETSDRLKSLFAGLIERRRRTASIRTRPILVTAGAAPKVIVTVDTEEQFDWSDFDRPAMSVAPPADIDRFQRLAEEFGARPLYFLTWPVIADAPSAAYFRKLRETGKADLGLHLHQWATPPVAGFAGEYYSFQCNLPDAVHREKLAALSRQFAKAFGTPARAHRAGRYGATIESYPALAGAGVDLDFSPSAAFDSSDRGGPDHLAMSNAPFIVAMDGRDVFVTPVCGARALKGGGIFLARRGGAPGFDGGHRKLPQKWAASARLTCEGMSLADLKALTKRLMKDGTPVLTFSLHSTTMTPGANPYALDEAGVSKALDTARRYFQFIKTLGGGFLSLEDLAALYGVPERDKTAVNLNPALNAHA